MKKLIFTVLFTILLLSLIGSVIAESNDTDDEENGLEIEADVFIDITTVKVEINDVKTEFTTSVRTREAIITQILDRFSNLTRAQVDSALDLEVENRVSRLDDLNSSSGGSDDDTDDENETEDDSSNRIRERFEERMRNGKREVKYEYRDGDNRVTYRLREKLQDSREEIRLKIRDRNITFNHSDNDRIEMILGRINVRTDLNLTVDNIDNVSLGQVLRAYLSNGRFAEIKVMPDSASETALKRLRAKCEERNCTIELKEIHNNRTNTTRIAYEVNTEKDSKFLFVFNKKMKVGAEVDAETGEIISVHKPWWAKIAREKDDSDAEIEAELNVSAENNTG